jgi:hypothetical protein
MTGTKYVNNRKIVVYHGSTKTEGYFIGYTSPGYVANKYPKNTRDPPAGKKGKPGYKPAADGWDHAWANDESVTEEKRDVAHQ